MTHFELNWEKAKIQAESTVEDAIKLLNVNSLRIALVVDSQDKLLGTLSDGDIRRGILKGLSLANSINTIVNRDPIVVYSRNSTQEAAYLMIKHKIQQIPILNEDRQVLGIHLWDQVNEIDELPNVMVIMAGGKGERLLPQTERCPKPMLLVGGKPILERIILRAKKSGITRFIIAIHYLGDVIEDYFGNGEEFGVEITYLRENSPLGTAGALSLIEETPRYPILITNGDVLTDINYADVVDFHVKNNASATVAVRSYEIQNPFGVVETDGLEITSYIEKPVIYSLINAGIYVLEPIALSEVPRNTKFNMPELLDLLMKEDRKVIAYPAHERWLDVGIPEELSKAEKEELQGGN
jgi:dTDP-glucose pyrophosphorylase